MTWHEHQIILGVHFDLTEQSVVVITSQGELQIQQRDERSE
jgi:hypothetical protein